jgi:hypothetical protein
VELAALPADESYARPEGTYAFQAPAGAYGFQAQAGAYYYDPSAAASFAPPASYDAIDAMHRRRHRRSGGVLMVGRR